MGVGLRGHVRNSVLIVMFLGRYVFEELEGEAKEEESVCVDLARVNLAESVCSVWHC